ncbi:GNAT family N-acetyltransferase [Flavobacterium sp. YJ01]|uniref:GNAT family N-acetyltransferase n=1 Tax=unclassified Flavobacterium TaxID=196869 RepID=UPI0023E3686C|nr:GNAT family N-acetyltransferase [Flavobacterium sp. YJ01]WET01963.1 GNAT family N-acetyltransferase [Flavobacterium sp. YJ01]
MLHIVEFRNNHLSSLQEIFLEERKRTFIWNDISEFELDDFIKQTQGECILTALWNDIPVGFISIWMPNNFIHHLYVNHNYQGKNIGSELLKAAILKTNFPLTLKCLEKNTKAIDFYIKNGFVEKEKGHSNNGIYILFELTKEVK